MLTRIALIFLLLLAVALAAAALILSGDCNRPDDGDDDAGEMEPADTCKPGDQACHAYEPVSSSGPVLRGADPGEP